MFYFLWAIKVIFVRSFVAVGAWILHSNSKIVQLSFKVVVVKGKRDNFFMHMYRIFNYNIKLSSKFPFNNFKLSKTDKTNRNTQKKSPELFKWTSNKSFFVSLLFLLEKSQRNSFSLPKSIPFQAKLLFMRVNIRNKKRRREYNGFHPKSEKSSSKHIWKSLERNLLGFTRPWMIYEIFFRFSLSLSLDFNNNCARHMYP